MYIMFAIRSSRGGWLCVNYFVSSFVEGKIYQVEAYMLTWGRDNSDIRIDF